MNSRQYNSKDIFKNIERGEYRDCYLIYNRKSTDEADSQKNSIDFQRKENLKEAKDNALKIASFSIEGFCADGVISERHSGFKEGEDLHISDDGQVTFQIDRPKFQRLVQFLNQGYVKGVVCLCWDRLSRNKADDTIIRKLMKKGVNVCLLVLRTTTVVLVSYIWTSTECSLNITHG